MTWYNGLTKLINKQICLATTRLRTNGVNTHGAAAKVMNFPDWRKGTPWTLGKTHFTGVPKSLCQKNMKFAATSLVLTSFVPFRLGQAASHQARQPNTVSYGKGFQFMALTTYPGMRCARHDVRPKRRKHMSWHVLRPAQKSDLHMCSTAYPICCTRRCCRHE